MSSELSQKGENRRTVKLEIDKMRVTQGKVYDECSKYNA
jgi:hypothetical protein